MHVTCSCAPASTLWLTCLAQCNLQTGEIDLDGVNGTDGGGGGGGDTVVSRQGAVEYEDSSNLLRIQLPHPAGPVYDQVRRMPWHTAATVMTNYRDAVTERTAL